MSRVDAAASCSRRGVQRAVRCGAVWSAVTLLTVTVLWLAGPGLAALPELARRPDSVMFEQLLVGCFAVLAALAALWGWLVTSAVVYAAARGAVGQLRGVPAPVRHLLLTCCGATLAGGAVVGLSAPADAVMAEPTAHRAPPVLLHLAGLPMPERATAVANPTRTVLVRPGDSLWRLADRALPPRASATEIAAFAHRIHRINHAVIGADPDLIRPYQRLRLPRR